MKLFKNLVWLLLMCNNICNSQTKTKKESVKMQENLETATFAGGCFWCTEALFLELKGVKTVVSGYIGGQTLNPTYKEVCSGTTGHAEATEIIFDSNIISFGELLEIFFATHDPTTLNQQGADKGTQYRSEIFYHNKEQKEISENYVSLLLKEKTFGEGSPITTKISEASKFYAAENYHQNYYNQNKEQGYCNYVITPKVEKLKKLFKNKLKN